MNEDIANGFMWWGIIVSAFWFVWITFKGMELNEVQRYVHDDNYNIRQRLLKLEEKVGIKDE